MLLSQKNVSYIIIIQTLLNRMCSVVSYLYLYVPNHLPIIILYITKSHLHPFHFSSTVILLLNFENYLMFMFPG